MMKPLSSTSHVRGKSILENLFRRRPRSFAAAAATRAFAKSTTIFFHALLLTQLSADMEMEASKAWRDKEGGRSNYQ